MSDNYTPPPMIPQQGQIEDKFICSINLEMSQKQFRDNTISVLSREWKTGHHRYLTQCSNKHWIYKVSRLLE